MYLFSVCSTTSPGSLEVYCFTEVTGWPVPDIYLFWFNYILSVIFMVWQMWYSTDRTTATEATKSHKSSTSGIISHSN